MTSKIIERIEKAIASLQTLKSQVETPVERIDIADITSDLKSALEKLQALQSYQINSDTNYDELWEERKEELRAYQESRDAWIRTEIFTQILKSMSSS